MRVGVPREIKNHEYRVGLIPSSAKEIVQAGHDVLIEAGAGIGSEIADAEYRAVGAKILSDAAAVFGEADLIVKVKEPQAQERKLLRKGQTLFTFLHLAPDVEQTDDLIRSGSTCIAYETVTSATGGLPLLAPMSEIAGRLAPQVGASALQKSNGGAGILLGGVPGVAPARVVILGAGVAGTHAAMISLGMGADVTVLDRSNDVLKRISMQFGGAVRTVFSTATAIEQHVSHADLVIGTVLVPGAESPKLVSRKMLSQMKPRSVIVDVAIDQGGCCETSRPTTHAEPTYVIDGIVHYCVANMPGAVARTSTFALNNATLPFIMEIANKGWRRACEDDDRLLDGLTVHAGALANAAIARAQAKAATPARRLVQDA